MRRAAQFESAPGRCLIVLLAGLIVLVGWAAVWPDLHACLHGSDAGAHRCGGEGNDQEGGDHFCAVTFLQAGSTLVFGFELDAEEARLIGQLLPERPVRSTPRQPVRPQTRAPPCLS